MAHRVHGVSSIARPVEPQYRSNAIALAILAGLGVLGAVRALNAGDVGIIGAAIAGLMLALTGFLTWALGREIDPDRNWTGFVAMGLAVAAELAGYRPSLWLVAFALFATRMVNRTVGLPVRFGDVIMISAASGAAVFLGGYSEIGVVAAIAFSIDALFDRKRTLNFLGAAIALSFTVWELIGIGGDIQALLVDSVAALPQIWLYGGLGVIGGGLLHALLLGRVASVGDATGEPLSGLRVRAGVFVIALTALASLTEGVDGIAGATPVFAVLAASVIGRFIPGFRAAE
jgi:hypothetical protein